MTWPSFCIFCSLHPITNAWISLYVVHIPFPSFLHIFQLKYETGMHQVRILIESYNVLRLLPPYSHQIHAFFFTQLFNFVSYRTEKYNSSLPPGNELYLRLWCLWQFWLSSLWSHRIGPSINYIREQLPNSISNIVNAFASYCYNDAFVTYWVLSVLSCLDNNWLRL